ncbi:MAG: class I SAM-dependent methyltransferase [Ignavibacteriaceae bacterium]|nr:class I SAM-dependent methyltransferase [Ignavibacteriaceae bacterium]
MDTHKKSYQHQIEHLKKYPEDRCKLMLNHNTVNRWRLERLYQSIDPLLNMFPNSEWLTVGDFYYGSDAQYIQSKGFKVIASDVDDHFLKKGKEIGYINNYSQENVESLSYGDESFDFVLCKETLHHLPRPYIGLYEMLRVSKVGVVLIEPFDRFINASTVEKSGNWLLRKLQGKMHDLYEPSGNYKYPISKREMEKIALGLNLPYVAFNIINDYYRDKLGIEFKEKDDPVLNKVKRQIALRDFLWKFRLFPPTYLVAIIFKTDIKAEILKTSGYEVIKLFRNPYLIDSQI